MLQLKVKSGARRAVFLQLLLLLGLQQQIAQAVNFAGCDNVYNLKPSIIRIGSPNYPQGLPLNSSCRYKYIAPHDHYIEAKCDIDLDRSSSGSCSSEAFYISPYDDIQLIDAEYFCGKALLQRRSTLRTMVLAYTSRANSAGRFSCALEVKPQPCDCGWSVNTKISGGNQVQVNQYPSMVAIKDKMSSGVEPYCGAVIVSHYYVVTAAKCVNSKTYPKQLIAIVGDYDLSSGSDTPYAALHEIEQIIKHPSFNPTTNANDIALLKTVNPIEWSRGVGPICLPPSANASQSFANELAQVLGWGTTSFGGPNSRALLKADLMITTNADCNRRTGNNPTVTNSMMCTLDTQGQRRSTCQEDIGGPVVLTKQGRQFLVGIISSAGCGRAGTVGINTRLTTYLLWINQYTGQTCRKLM